MKAEERSALLMTENVFAKELGIPLPKCCSHGDCCKGASPSTPWHKLMDRARGGDEFARGFFSLMIPYKSHEEARKIVPGVVERSLKAMQKLEEFKTEEDLVFYHCRYQTADNKCGVWEDRPQFCRDYPDTPFVVMAPGCAFEGWGAACKVKYQDMKEEVSKLKDLKKELDELRGLQGQQALSGEDYPVGPEIPEGLPTPGQGGGYPVGRSAEGSANTMIDEAFSAPHNTDNLSLVLSLTKLYLASPLHSVYM